VWPFARPFDGPFPWTVSMIPLRKALSMSRINSHLTFYALAHMHKPCEAIESVAPIIRRLGFDTVRIPVDNAVAGVDDAVGRNIE
jgi:hypothetical protein